LSQQSSLTRKGKVEHPHQTLLCLLDNQESRIKDAVGLVACISGKEELRRKYTLAGRLHLDMDVSRPTRIKPRQHGL